MIADKNNIIVEIGDIVKIENSPIKSDNGTYVVSQDGTSKGYSGSDLTLYKVAKHKGGYSLSKASYNICFFPLCNYSSKYHYTREEMEAATIEILLKADNTAFEIAKSDDKYENEETEQTYFKALVKSGDKEIEDISYPASQKEKMIAFFSNITLKQGETIEIIKQDHTWGYYYKNISYELVSNAPVEEVKEIEKTTENKTTEQEETTKQQPIQAECNNLHFDITEDTDTRNNNKIYVVKVVEKLDRDEYLKVNSFIKSINGYYSKFKHGFIFKEDPTELLNGSNTTVKRNTEAKITETEKSKENKTEEQTTQSQQAETKKQIDFEIEQSQHTKTKENIWLVKVKDNLSKDDFAEVKRNFATLKGFYSSFNNSFIFKYDPSEKLQTSA